MINVTPLSILLGELGSHAAFMLLGGGALAIAGAYSPLMPSSNLSGEWSRNQFVRSSVKSPELTDNAITRRA